MATTLTFTIADEAAPRIVAALKGLFPIPLDEDGEPLFTDNAWAKEYTRRWWKAQVSRYEEGQSVAAARGSVVAIPDADIA